MGFTALQGLSLLVIICCRAVAQVEPNTAPFKAPEPVNVWAQNVDAAHKQYLAQVTAAGPLSFPATEAVSILRLVGSDVVPFTPEKQIVSVSAFIDIMPPGGLLEFITYQEGAPELDNPDQTSFGEPYTDAAAILWQLLPDVAPGKPIPWGTQSQAALLWGGALQQRGLNVTVKVMSLNVAQSMLTHQVQLFPIMVVQIVVELELNSGNTTAAEVGVDATTNELTPDQTWAVINGAEQYLNGWAASHIDVSQVNQTLLIEKYPDIAANLAPGKALLEVEMSIYACQEFNTTTNGAAPATAGGNGETITTQQPPENCELDVAKKTLEAFFNLPSTISAFSQVGLGRNNAVLAAQYRPLPPGAMVSTDGDTTTQENAANGSNTNTNNKDAWLPWHLDILDQRSLPLDGKFTSTADGTGVNVYIISSGVQADHQEFAQKNADGSYNLEISRVNGLWGVDGIDPRTDCPDGNLWYHFGTWAASIIAGSRVGVAKNATLHSVRMRDTCILDNRNIWSPGALPSALDAVMSTFKKPGIIAIDTWWSPSRLADDDNDYIQTEIGSRLRKAAQLGIPIITTSGVGVSSSTPCDNIFSQGESVIKVAGIDSNLRASITGSTNSKCIDIWAPGGGLSAAITGASANAKDEYTSVVPRGFGGAWLVAGMAAQYLQLHPNATFSELKSALIDASTVGVVQGAGPESRNALAFTNLMSPGSGDGNGGSGRGVNGGAAGDASGAGSSDSGISTGAIVGIVIAALVASIVGVALFITLTSRKARHGDGDINKGNGGSFGKFAFLYRGSGSSGGSSKNNNNGGDEYGPGIKYSPISGTPAAAANLVALDTPAKIKKHDWEIKEDQIEYVPGPNGSEYWVLGRGRYGEVRRALKDGIQEVAVKTLRRDIDALGELPHDAFAREIAVMQWLSRDANVVQFFGACVRPGSMLLVTELMEGGDLRGRLRPYGSSSSSSKNKDNKTIAIASDESKEWGWYSRGKGVALDVARGLHFLHSHGVVHRDIKSKNILLGRDGRAKLGDVGLAYISFSETPDDEKKKQRGSSVQGSSNDDNDDDGFVGTFAFSAPEMILCGACTPKADVYSFGVVLWEIITGDVAVRGHLRPPRVPEECPEDVVEVLNACLSADPDERPSAREAYEYLIACPPFESSTPGYDYQQQQHYQQGAQVSSVRLSNGSSGVEMGSGITARGLLTSPPLVSPLAPSPQPPTPQAQQLQPAAATGVAPRTDSLTLPSLGSDSLPSISAGGSHEIAFSSKNVSSSSVRKAQLTSKNSNNSNNVNAGGGAGGGGGGGNVEDSQGYSSSSSSLIRSLGSLTPGLRSVVHQIRRRLAGDAVPELPVDSGTSAGTNLNGVATAV